MDAMHAQQPRAACSDAAPTMWSAPSRTIGDHPRRPQGDRLQRRALARNRRQGTWPHRAPTLCRRRPLRRRVGPTPISMVAARRCASNASARSSRPASAASRWPTASPRSAQTAPGPRSCWPWATTHIENRLHYVRDFTYDEDRCRAYVRHMPRNLACLTNAAIARAHDGRARGQPPLCRPRARPRRHPEHARRLIPQAPPQKRVGRGASAADAG